MAEFETLEGLGREGLSAGRQGGDVLEDNHQRMPGVLRFSKEDRGELELPENCSAKSVAMEAFKQDNGDRKEPYGNGVLTANGIYNDALTQSVNSDLATVRDVPSKPFASMEGMARQLPPEIEHITFGYLPFSSLITRLVQETFNGLTEVINGMSDAEIPQVNGFVAANPLQANTEKKLRLLNFAQERRAQFIKSLVLSQWSRHADAISEVIDLRVWLDGRKRLYEDACSWIGELKRILSSEKIPNPDLRTALEALSLGRTSQMPNIGYIPPQLLFPSQLLKALRDINTQLSIRLNLYETIPPVFRSYRIANGRVTFQSHDEFEIDLSVATDDPSSQLYFIDFRFLFSPSPNSLPPGSLRDELEARSNDVLKREGLDGCYRFLHEFVLSHKLNIFKSQAYQMLQGNWSDHLKVEAVHRSVVVQYWTNRPGGKNWIEIGISRRNLKRVSWLHNIDTAHIAMRCFRAGKEVADVPVVINLSTLSLDTVLKNVISAHTNQILGEIAASVREAPLYSKKVLGWKHVQSVNEPSDGYLSVQMTVSKHLEILQEVVTGRFALLPPSQLHSRVEWELNGLTAATDLSSRIANLRAITSLNEIEVKARSCGWELVTSVRPNQETLKRHFSRDTLRSSFFRKKSWNPLWLLACTTGQMGDMWFLVELVDSVANSGLNRNQIRAAYNLSIAGLNAATMEPSCARLSAIECITARMISQFADTRQLTHQRIPHRLTDGTPRPSGHRLPALHIYLPKRRAQSMLLTRKPFAVPWTSQVIKVAFMGVDTATCSVIHIVAFKIRSATSGLKALGSSIGSSTVFHPSSGMFAFRLMNAVGESVVPAILDRLASTQRLVSYITTLRKCHFECKSISLDHLDFIYATSPRPLSARIVFAKEGRPRLSLDRGSPHLRIQDHLASFLTSEGGLSEIIRLLQMTLPVMRAFATLEANDTNNGIIILPRSVTWYHVRFSNPPTRFDLRLKRRKDEFLWMLQELSVPQGETRDNRIRDHMKTMIDGHGKGWTSMHPGIATTLEGAETLLEGISEIVRNISNADTAEKMLKETRGEKRKAEEDVVVLD